jgi:hypothetical protein
VTPPMMQVHGVPTNPTGFPVVDVLHVGVEQAATVITSAVVELALLLLGDAPANTPEQRAAADVVERARDLAVNIDRLVIQRRVRHTTIRPRTPRWETPR